MTMPSVLKKIFRRLSTPAKYLDPNRHAERSQLIVSDSLLTVRGYQRFTVNRATHHIIPVGTNSITKYNILNEFLKRHIADVSFLDIGSNNGLFVFLAAHYGARHATGVDIDETYLGTAREISRLAKFNEVRFDNENFENVTVPADVVLFLSMLHWVYSKTSLYGSLEKIINHLAGLTRHCLIIEWISPDDHKIKRDCHLTYNQKIIVEPYDFDHFEQALKKHFGRYELLGVNTPTRLVYVAWK